MEPNTFNSLNLGMNENDVPLTPVTSTDSSYSPLMQQDLNATAFYYDPGLYQQYAQLQSYTLDPTQHNPLSMNQPAIAPSWSSTSSPAMHNRAYLASTPPSQSTASTSTNQPYRGPDRIQTAGLVPIAKRPSISHSVRSSHGSDDDDTPSEPASPTAKDEATERRKSRRRAQNRAAQRAFRARKEETIKESGVRLDALQGELARLQDQNGCLSETVSELRGRVVRLQRENGALRRQSQGEPPDWPDYEIARPRQRPRLEDEAAAPDDTTPGASLTPNDDEFAGFNLGVVGTLQWDPEGDGGGGGGDGLDTTTTTTTTATPAKMAKKAEARSMGDLATDVGSAIYDAAATLLR